MIQKHINIENYKLCNIDQNKVEEIISKYPSKI